MKTIKTIVLSIFAGLLILTILTGNMITSTAAPRPSADEITAEEAADMQFMVEEEKLARDVYITLGETWDRPIFQNISESEQIHVDSIRTLLDRYGVEDPTLDKEVGEFVDHHLQELYDLLVEKGSQSLADALYVGGEIEELDILDLEMLCDKTDKADIQRVYTNLMEGSENHLRAFVSSWEDQTGEVYIPQLLDQERFEEIMSGSQGNGGVAAETARVKIKLGV